jgi:hypothetical protein
VKTLLLLMLCGCFDSIVSDPCAAGFSLQGGACAAFDAGTRADATTTDAASAVDAQLGVPLTCTLPEVACQGVCLDVTNDPLNCGACGRVCPSGVCELDHCIGGLPGHIVAIGHDYQATNGAMVRVIGNAVTLGLRHDVGVAQWHGTASNTSIAGASAAINSSLSALGRPWHQVAMPDSAAENAFAAVDVLIIDAQTGDGNLAQSAGATWQSAIDVLLANGGVVIVLEGWSGVSYRFAQGAGLYTVSAPVGATGQSAVVVDGTDVVAEGVVSPYLAAATSVTEGGATNIVIATPAGDAIVTHVTR